MGPFPAKRWPTTVSSSTIAEVVNEDFSRLTTAVVVNEDFSRMTTAKVVNEDNNLPHDNCRSSN